MNLQKANKTTKQNQKSPIEKEKYLYVMNFKPLELGKRKNSCIKVNIRELDREPFTK